MLNYQRVPCYDHGTYKHQYQATRDGGTSPERKQQSQWKQHGCLMLALLRKNCCLESVTIRKKINHQYKLKDVLHVGLPQPCSHDVCDVKLVCGQIRIERHFLGIVHP